jgi:hypothetical protein
VSDEKISREEFREAWHNLVADGSIVDSGMVRNGKIVWVTPKHAKTTPEQQLATRILVMNKYAEEKKQQEKPRA